MSGKKVLVLAAHPDDETLGCGATLRMLADQGHDILLITFTDGVSSRDDPEATNRNDRLTEVCHRLGIKHWASGDFPDNQMDTVPLLKLTKFIEDQMDKYDFEHPEMVFTHHADCLNVDHALVYRATVTALRPQSGKKCTIYSYYVPSSTDYNPMLEFKGNSYFTMGVESAQLKIDVLRELYGDEMREYPHSRSYENVMNLMKVWGSEVGALYAEKFVMIRDIR